MDVWFVVVIFALPIAGMLYRAFDNARRKRDWEDEAARLGLQASGSVHELAMAGSWRGMPVEIKHSVTYVYKGAPQFTFVARLQCAGELQAWRFGPDSDGVQRYRLLDGGWLEHDGARRLEANEVEPLLEALLERSKRA